MYHSRVQCSLFVLLISSSLPPLPRAQIAYMDVDEDSQSSQWLHGGGAMIPYESPYGARSLPGTNEVGDRDEADDVDPRLCLPSSVSATATTTAAAAAQSRWFEQRLADDAKTRASAAIKRQRHVELLTAQLPPFIADARAADLVLADAAAARQGALSAASLVWGGCMLFSTSALVLH